jgi:hypothetical protein
MVQQCKQMRVGACEVFAYHSGKVVLLANGKRFGVDSNSLLSGKAVYMIFKYCPVPTLYLFLETS